MLCFSFTGSFVHRKQKKNSQRNRVFQHHKRFLRNYWVNCCKSLFTFTAVKTTYCCNKSLHKFTAVNKIHTDLQKLTSCKTTHGFRYLKKLHKTLLNVFMHCCAYILWFFFFFYRTINIFHCCEYPYIFPPVCNT